MRLLVMALSLALGFSALADSADTVGLLNDFKGDVSIFRAADEMKANRGMELKEGDAVLTKANSAARVVMRDSNVFVIGENTRLELKTYAAKNPPGPITLLLQGDLHSNVLNKSQDEKPNLRIVAPGGVVGVRGTEFLTEAHANTVRVTTFGGVVEVGESLEGRKINNAVVVEKGFQFLGSPGKYEGKSAYLLNSKQMERIHGKWEKMIPGAKEASAAEAKKSEDKGRSGSEKKTVEKDEKSDAKKPEHVK